MYVCQHATGKGLLLVICQLSQIASLSRYILEWQNIPDSLENGRHLGYEAMPEGQSEEPHWMLDLTVLFSKSLSQKGVVRLWSVFWCNVILVRYKNWSVSV